MVANVTSLTRSGLADFLVQRVSAVVMGAYTLCVLGFFYVTPDVDHVVLRDYFGSFAMQTFSTLTILSTAAHAWIGLWTVGTDYIRPHYAGPHATAIRLTFQAGVMAILFFFVVFSLQLFWNL
jgi:succinate dehydrogenase / fumarate reductase membrane anchor subunit